MNCPLCLKKRDIFNLFNKALNYDKWYIIPDEYDKIDIIDNFYNLDDLNNIYNIYDPDDLDNFYDYDDFYDLDDLDNFYDYDDLDDLLGNEYKEEYGGAYNEFNKYSVYC
ncbi:44208_t:CDS:1 [Gigaspora margarita]|uniref:44208_t:CDS:1 n=1 Tax=Gigaspora margarita TaxID=4874 RepID=A0ABN7VKH8_GIGMA|nr:44208_t:CDS:1 [Gigaspora margarita]